MMDNVGFLKSNLVLNCLREIQILCKFTVPCSPELNPIKDFFSMFKASYNAIRTGNNNLSMRYYLDQCFLTFFSRMRIFYNNMQNWMAKSRRREHFI